MRMQPPVNQQVVDKQFKATPELIRYFVAMQDYIKKLEKRIEKLEQNS